MPVIPNQEAANNTALNMIESIFNPDLTDPFASIWVEKLKAMRKVPDTFRKNNTPQEAPQKKYKTSDGGSQHTIIHLWQMHIQGWKVLATCQPKTKATPPTPIVSYDEEDLYTPTRMETDTIHGVTLSYNKWNQKWLINVHNKVKDTLNLISNCL